VEPYLVAAPKKVMLFNKNLLTLLKAVGGGELVMGPLLGFFLQLLAPLR
jgi:hypothetical protein